MKALVTGGTGFTGSYVVPLLLERGLRVTCLVRPTSDTSRLPTDSVNLVPGDVGDPESLEKALAGMDALVNIASLGFGHAPDIVSAAVKASVKRSVFIGTTAIFTRLNAASKSVRQAAEDAVMSSGLDYTILRPTMIYGSSRDRNMCRLIRYMRRWPIVPVFGNGWRLQQPVYVADVARAVADCLVCKPAIGRAYNIAGRAPLSFNAIISTVAEALGRRTRRLHLPVGPVVSGLRIMEKAGLRLPVKSEQVLRLDEDKAFDYSAAAGDFGYRPRSFEEGIRLEIEEMGLGRPAGDFHTGDTVR